MEFIVAVPLDAAPVTVKFALDKPSALSLAVNVPVIAPPSSSPLPAVLPPNVASSFTLLTVTVISCVSTLLSSSVIVTVNVSVPLKLPAGV